MIEAVVFDLDDTLYPERQFAFSGFGAVASAFESVLGPAPSAAARMRELFDSPARGRVFDTLLAERAAAGELPQVGDQGHTPQVGNQGHTPQVGDLGHRPLTELVADMVRCYRHHLPRISLHPDADRALSRLRAGHVGGPGALALGGPASGRPIKLGLISDGPAVVQGNKIAALGLAGRLDEIILTDELGPGFGKPDPRAFEMMAQRLNVQPSACVYVADNPAKDFQAPARLGWRTVRLVRSDGIYANAACEGGAEPAHTISSLDELDGVLFGGRR